MMFKGFVLSVFFITALFSKSFNFSEQRYSDALGSYISLRGEISFELESLYIKYSEKQREILYKDSTLTLKEDGKEQELDEIESARISHYFEILLLIYSGDESSLNEKFEVQKQDNKTTLIPKGSMSNFLNKVELERSNEILKEVKLFLNNMDRITISIEDEIH